MENMKGICQLPLVPVRKEPHDKSEMVTQVLFGETLQIILTASRWLQVILDADGYEGWVDKKMIDLLDDQQFIDIGNLPAFTFSGVVLKARSLRWKSDFMLPAGSIIRNFKKGQNEFGYNQDVFRAEMEPASLKHPSRKTIVHTAGQFINSPYLWGGKSFLGIDCSGLTQLVMKINGITIPRDAKQQVETGRIRNFISEGLPGDLAFFDNDEGEIIHTGIILPDNEIIHASGRVRVDRIDQQGIFNMEQKQYTHKLRLVRSFIE